MRLSSFWPLLPAILGLVSVFCRPGDSDRAAVDEVRAQIGRAVATITTALSGGTEMFEPNSAMAAADPAESSRPTMHYNRHVTPATSGPKVQRTWENRPIPPNYSNGRNTRLSYGESQRDSKGRLR